MPRLYLLSGADVGKSFDVVHGATFGRGADCTVHLRDASVSRLHARLETVDDRWTIIDLESRNGLRVGGQRVANAPLADGDEFTLGEVLLRFRTEGAAPPRATPVSTTAQSTVDESIQLEGDWSGATMTFPVARPLAETATTAREESVLQRASAGLGVTANAHAPATVDRSRPVLQYQRVAQREGVLNAELAQLPIWARFGLYALAIVVAAALFVVAFKGTLLLKERAPVNDSALPAADE